MSYHLDVTLIGNLQSHSLCPGTCTRVGNSPSKHFVAEFNRNILKCKLFKSDSIAGSSIFLKSSDGSDSSLKFVVTFASPAVEHYGADPYGNTAVFHQREGPSAMWMGLGNGLALHSHSKQLVWALSNVIKKSLQTPNILFDAIRYRFASVDPNIDASIVDQHLSSPSVMLKAALQYTTGKFSKVANAAAYYTLSRLDTNTGILSYVNVGDNQITAWRLSSSPEKGYQNILKTNEELFSYPDTMQTIDISGEGAHTLSGGLPTVGKQMQLGDIIVMGNADAFRNFYLSSKDFEDIASSKEEYEFTNDKYESVKIYSTDSIEYRRRELNRIPTVKSVIDSALKGFRERLDAKRVQTDVIEKQLADSICKTLVFFSDKFNKGKLRNPSIFTVIDVPSGDQTSTESHINELKNRLREAITSSNPPKKIPFKSTEMDKFYARSKDGSKEASTEAKNRFIDRLGTYIAPVPNTRLLRIIDKNAGGEVFQCGHVYNYRLCDDLRRVTGSQKLLFTTVLFNIFNNHRRVLTVEDLFNSANVLQANLKTETFNVELLETLFPRDLSSYTKFHPLDELIFAKSTKSRMSNLSVNIWNLLTSYLFNNNFACFEEKFFKKHATADPHLIYNSLFGLECNGVDLPPKLEKYQSFYQALQNLLKSDERETMELVGQNLKGQTINTVEELTPPLRANADSSLLAKALLSDGLKLILYFSSILTSKQTYLINHLQAMGKEPHTKIRNGISRAYFISKYESISIDYETGNCLMASPSGNADFNDIQKSNYKIHLSPKLQYLYIIYQAIQQELLRDPELERDVRSSKVKMNFQSLSHYVNESLDPLIVIYVQPALNVKTFVSSEEGQAVQCALESRRTFMKVLKRIVLLHQEWKRLLGTDIGLSMISRGNYPIDDLISVAHYLGGDGDYLRKKAKIRRDLYESGKDLKISTNAIPFEFASEEEKKCMLKQDMKYFKAKTRKGDTTLGIPEVDYLPLDEVKDLLQEVSRSGG